MLLSIWGAKGTGKTSLALELAKRLSDEGNNTLLISPLPYSELSVLLNVKIPKEQSLQAAIRTGNLKQSVFKKDDLFYLLSAPSQHDAFDDNYSAEKVKAMLTLASSTFDYVLCDCPSEMDNLVAAWSMSLADKVLLCMGGDLEGAMWHKASNRALDAIKQKTVFVGMEQTTDFDYESLYDFLEQKPHYRLPNRKAKTYEKSMMKLLEVMKN